MFTRVLEIASKAGKMKELSNTVTDKVLPILRNQPGFVDEIVLVSTEDPNRMLSMSFWRTQHDAEIYQNEQYSKINDLVKNLVETKPVVRTFNVDHSTQHKIAAGKAA